MGDSTLTTDSAPAWYALKSQSKREHIAAAAIRARTKLEVFCPRITYIKQTQRRGRVRFTEALFPGYLFVHCEINKHFRNLLAMQGIRGVLRYGSEFPVVPESFINELKNEMPSECWEVAADTLREGSEVVVAEGPLMNIKAVISGILPASQRVNLLLEFLGRQITMHVPASAVIAAKPEPKSFLRKSTG